MMRASSTVRFARARADDRASLSLRIPSLSSGRDRPLPPSLETPAAPNSHPPSPGLATTIPHIRYAVMTLSRVVSGPAWRIQETVMAAPTLLRRMPR